jgi:hypothetical protein
MAKRFFIYDNDGNPSSQSFTPEEVKAKQLSPDTIVCPEFGRPGKMEEFAELKSWAPPIIHQPPVKSFIKNRPIVFWLIGILILIGGGTSLFIMYGKSSRKEANNACLDFKKSLQNTSDSLFTIKETLLPQIEEKEREIDYYNTKILEQRNKVINLTNKIPMYENLKQQEAAARDRAAAEWCILQDCIDRRAATVQRHNNTISTYDNYITSIRSEAQQIEQVLIPDLKRKLQSEETNITVSKTKLSEIENEIKNINIKLSNPCEDL